MLWHYLPPAFTRFYPSEPGGTSAVDGLRLAHSSLAGSLGSAIVPLDHHHVSRTGQLGWRAALAIYSWRFRRVDHRFSAVPVDLRGLAQPSAALPGCLAWRADCRGIT